jgi:protein TonB
MFIESFVESGGPRQAQLRWATLISFTLQALAVCTLLALPLYFTGALPPVHASPQTVWPSSGRHAEFRQATSLVRVPGSLARSGLQQPSFIPTGIHELGRITTATDFASADSLGTEEGPGPYGVLPGPGGSDGIASLLAPPASRVTTVAAPEKRLVISHLDEGLLLRRVDPEYPQMARLARIQGQVLLMAVINIHGEVDQLRVVAGLPLLAKAASDAVRQWRYRPYLLNGKPCEVETQITVNFRLGEQ